jgi:oligoribonuclease
MEEAESIVLEFISSHAKRNEGILAGNSVHMDKFFLMKDMPKIIQYLHYRLVDVSTIKELSRRWYPSVFEKAPTKKTGHR